MVHVKKDKIEIDDRVHKIGCIKGVSIDKSFSWDSLKADYLPNGLIDFEITWKSPQGTTCKLIRQNAAYSELIIDEGVLHELTSPAGCR